MLNMLNAAHTHTLTHSHTDINTLSPSLQRAVHMLNEAYNSRRLSVCFLPPARCLFCAVTSAHTPVARVPFAHMQHVHVLTIVATGSICQARRPARRNNYKALTAEAATEMLPAKHVLQTQHSVRPAEGGGLWHDRQRGAYCLFGCKF